MIGYGFYKLIRREKGAAPPHLVLLFQADDSCPPGDPRARPCIAYVE